MKKLLMIISLMMVFSMMAAPAVKADTLYLNGVNGQTNLTGSVYIDPYFGGLNNPTASGNIFCVDPMHESTQGTKWAVNITNLGTDNLANTYLGDSALVQYEEMAYLILYNMNNWSKSLMLAQNQAIQAAIWYIAAPNSIVNGHGGNGYGLDGLENTWVTFAAANYQGGDYSNVLILTDVGGYNQEFMTFVPEPTTMMLLGLGLIGLAGIRRKMQK